MCIFCFLDGALAMFLVSSFFSLALAFFFSSLFTLLCDLQTSTPHGIVSSGKKFEIVIEYTPDSLDVKVFRMKLFLETSCTRLLRLSD